MQRDTLLEMLRLPPPDGAEIVMPPIAGKKSGILLNEPISSLGDQIRFVSDLVRAGAMKSKNFEKMGMLEFKQGNAKASLPISIALQEIRANIKVHDQYIAKSFERTKPEAKRYYLNGGWKEIADSFGTDGLKAAFESKSFNDVVAKASCEPLAPKLMIVPGATPMHVSTPNSSMVIVGNGFSSQAATLVVDTVKEYTMALAANSASVLIANGVSPEKVVESEVEKHGLGFMAGMKAASELAEVSNRYRASVLECYPDYNQLIANQIQDLEQKLNASLMDNPGAFQRFAGEFGKAKLDLDYSSESSPSLTG